MKIVRIIKFTFLLFLIALMQLVFVPVQSAFAATTPSLGQAASFVILSSTYTNTVSGTTLTGDLGYTTGPAVAPTVNGTTYTPPSTKYTSAGTDQGSALANLNSQPCTFTFPAGAVDLATDTSHGTIGIYTPGVYCTTSTSAASIGTAGITLSGSGTYIFRVNGALTTTTGSVVTLSNGASACNVFWTPTAATTLGANTTFSGINIDDSGITIGSTVSWTGQALAFNGTVSTTTDTMSVPTCSTTTTSTTSTSTSTTGSTAPAAKVCPATNYVTPAVIDSKRVSPTSISLNWGPYSGVNTFIVEYGLTNGNWLYNTRVTGFSTTIQGLPANQPLWVRIAATDNCSVGSYGTPMLIGGPLLPNTGLAPREKSQWYTTIPIDMIALILASLGITFLSLMNVKKKRNVLS